MAARRSLLQMAMIQKIGKRKAHAVLILHPPHEPETQNPVLFHIFLH